MGKTFDDETFIYAVKSNTTVGETLDHLGLTRNGGNYRTFNKLVKKLKVDISHFRYYANCNKKKKLEEILVEDSDYPRHRLKKRLLENKLIENHCNICGLKDFWNDLPIVLILDHKNGINNDNRLDNLRMICPNCNSQQSTFSGRNKNKRR